MSEPGTMKQSSAPDIDTSFEGLSDEDEGEYQASLKTLSEKCDVLERENYDLRVQLQVFAKGAGNQPKLTVSLKEELRDLVLEYTDNRLAKRYRQLQKQYKKALENADRSHSVLERRDEQIQNLSDTVEKLRGELMETQSARDTAYRERDNFGQQVLEDKSQRDAIQIKHQSLVDELNRKLADRDRQLTDLRESNLKLRDSNFEITRRLNKGAPGGAAQMAFKRGSSPAGRGGNGIMTSSSLAAEQAKESMGNNAALVAKLEDEKSEHIRRIRELETNNRETNSFLEKVQEVLSEERAKNAGRPESISHARENEEMRRQLTLRNKEIEDLREEVEETIGTLSQVQTRVRILENEKQKLEDDAGRYSEAQRDNSDQIRRQEEEIMLLRQRLGEREEELEEALSQAEELSLARDFNSRLRVRTEEEDHGNVRASQLEMDLEEAIRLLAGCLEWVESPGSPSIDQGVAESLRVVGDLIHSSQEDARRLVSDQSVRMRKLSRRISAILASHAADDNAYRAHGADLQGASSVDTLADMSDALRQLQSDLCDNLANDSDPTVSELTNRVRVLETELILTTRRKDHLERLVSMHQANVNAAISAVSTGGR